MRLGHYLKLNLAFIYIHLFAFLDHFDFRDGNTTVVNIQIVFENNLPNFDDICKLTTGSSISIEGKLVASQ